MTTSLKLTATLCLLAVAYFRVSEAVPRMSINDHLLKNCMGYNQKLLEEDLVCDSEVIDHVHDHAEELNFPGYDGDIVEDFLDIAADGGLCYLAEGNKAETVKGPQGGDCAAMDMVCSETDPKVVDLCSRVRKQAAQITPSPSGVPTTQAVNI